MKSITKKIGASGLAVFPDGRNKLVDRIRLSEKDPRKVILVVALQKAVDVVRTYSRQYSPSLEPELVRMASSLFLPKLVAKHHRLLASTGSTK